MQENDKTVGPGPALSLQPVDARVYWDAVKDGLAAVKKKIGAEWIPEDIYARCIAGLSHLYYSPQLFVVLEERVDPVTGDKALFIWAAYGQQGADLHPEYLPELKEIAKNIGATGIEFETTRRGFEKKGWNVDSITYRLEV